jgi:hypothetical protein
MREETWAALWLLTTAAGVVACTVREAADAVAIRWTTLRSHAARARPPRR